MTSATHGAGFTMPRMPRLAVTTADPLQGCPVVSEDASGQGEGAEGKRPHAPHSVVSWPGPVGAYRAELF